MMTRLLNKMFSKLSFKGSMMTRLWNKNLHTKVSFKAARWWDRGIKMFTIVSFKGSVMTGLEKQCS